MYRHILAEEGITEVAVLPIEHCRLIRRHLLSESERYRSVILFLVPYRVRSEQSGRNVSEYAVPRDYHAYMKTLFDRILPRMRDTYGDTLGFADHSPIDERSASLLAGLGVIGKNGLLISERYGTYVFIGEMITEAEPSALGDLHTVGEVHGCIGCGACLRACPTGCLSDYEKPCLSAITQKKGELSPEERALIVKHGCAWGCDVCQSVCPMNRDVADTPIAFFREERIAHLTEKDVLDMDDCAFSMRAFSWRGRKTVMRNLALLENSGEQE